MKKKTLDSLTAKAKSYEPTFNPEVNSSQYPNKELVPLNALFCSYHPVTFIGNCLQCDMKCSYLESIIGPELTDVISTEDRNELLEYYFGPDTPNIKIAEKYGITLRVQILRDNPLYAPKNIQYLRIKKEDGTITKPTYEHIRKHWRTYYQGYWLWKAAGTMSQAGLLVQSLPKEMTQYIEYYKFHRNKMESKDKGSTVLMDLNLLDQELPNKQVEMEFKDEKSATKYFIRNAIRALCSSDNYNEYEAKEFIKQILSEHSSEDQEKEE